MILLLSGQVDIRKQEVYKKTEQLRHREQEVEHLQSTVQQLQSTIKGSDGSITLLKYQLAAARIGDSHNASMLQSQPSRSGVHVSPDRQSLLLHWKRSRPVLKDILGREKPCPVRYPIVESKNNTEEEVGSASDDVIIISTVVPCNYSLPDADNLAQRLVAQEQQNKQLEEQIVSWMAVMQHRIVGLEVVTNKATQPTSSEPRTSTQSSNEKDMVQASPSSTTAPLLLFRSPIKQGTHHQHDNPISNTTAVPLIEEKNLCNSTSSSSPSPRVMQKLFNGLRQSSPIAAVPVVVDGTPTTESKGVTLPSLPSSPAAPLSVPLSTLLNVADNDDDSMPFAKGDQSSLSSSGPEQQQQPSPQPDRQRSIETRATFDASSSSSSPLLQTVLCTPIKASAAPTNGGNINGSRNSGVGGGGGGGMDAFAVSTPGGSNVTFSATMDRIRRIKQKAAEAEAHSSRDKHNSTATAANRLVATISGEGSNSGGGIGGDPTMKVSQAVSRSDVQSSQRMIHSNDVAPATSVAGGSSSETVSTVGSASRSNGIPRVKVEGTSVEPTMSTNTPSKTLSRLLGGVTSSPTSTSTSTARPLGNNTNNLVNGKENSQTKIATGFSRGNDKENNVPPPLPLSSQPQPQSHHHQEGVAANPNALSPEQFSNEMVRLKHENGSIRDDILRFRGTLQRLREECQASATAVISTGGHAAAPAVSGRSRSMGGKSSDTVDDATTVLPNDSHQHHHHHPPYYSRPYNASREDGVSSSFSYLPRTGAMAATSNGNNHFLRDSTSSSTSATSGSRIESFLLGATQRRPPLSTSSLASYPMHPPVMTTSSSSSSLLSSTSTRHYFDNNNNNNNNNVSNGNGSVSEQGEGGDKGGVYLQYQSLQSFSTARRNIPLPPTHTTQQQSLKQQQQQKGLYGMPPTQKAGSRLVLSPYDDDNTGPPPPHLIPPNTSFKHILTPPPPFLSPSCNRSSSNSLTFADIDPTMIW